MNETVKAESADQYLTFYVARQEYAIDVLKVREVVGTAPITRVPAAAREVRGVVNLRGSVVPVVDLGLRLGGDAVSTTKRTCIVVVEPEGAPARARPVGLLVDSVNRVVALTPDAVVPMPPFGASPRADLVLGMGVVGPSFVLVLVPDKVARIDDRVEEAAP